MIDVTGYEGRNLVHVPSTTCIGVGTVARVRAEVPFDEWVVAVFDPGVEDPCPPPAQDLAHLTRLFADPVAALDGFTDEEVGIGLWSILDSGGAGTALALNDATLPLADRVACVGQIGTGPRHPRPLAALGTGAGRAPPGLRGGCPHRLHPVRTRGRPGAHGRAVGRCAGPSALRSTT